MNDNEFNVMIDLETWSQRKNAAIASIGACKFTDTGIIDKFYVNIDPVSCKEAGLHFQKETLDWWASQSKTVRDALKTDRVSLPDALDKFQSWFGVKSVPVWGNGVSFDNVILENAYITLNKPCPWKYWDERCFRTVTNLFKIKIARSGDLHNALDDAVSQTNTLLNLFKNK